MINGIRCTSCKKAWHWRCGGVTDEMTTTAILIDQNWECRLCRLFPPDDTEKNCPSCNILKTDITDLKKEHNRIREQPETIKRRIKVM